LSGIAWDHPRGVGGLRHATTRLALGNPDLAVDWDARPLVSFEDTPLAELAERYDLMAIDHPNIGDAIAAAALRSLDDLIPLAELDDLAHDTVGPTLASYRRDDRLWALPLDAACQVAAFRPDLLEGDVPGTWDELLEFSAAIGRKRMAIAANPTHLLCTALTLCEAIAPEPSGVDGRTTWWHEDDGPDPVVLTAAIERLRELLDYSDPASLEFDPIQLLEGMRSGDGHVYSPFVFGYVTYSRMGTPKTLRFAEPPRIASPRGSLAGGVGLAVSSASEAPTAAARVAIALVSRQVQAGMFADAGGQPARRTAWLDSTVDDAAGGFYSETIGTMEHAFLRPTRAGYPRWQRVAGRRLHATIGTGIDSTRIAGALIDEWFDCMPTRREASIRPERTVPSAGA
jgi:multiple sugar transport system substrate-binding protein